MLHAVPDQYEKLERDACMTVTKAYRRYCHGGGGVRLSIPATGQAAGKAQAYTTKLHAPKIA